MSIVSAGFATGTTVELCSPFDGSRIGTIETASAADIEDSLARAFDAKSASAAMPRHERAAILSGAARSIQARREEFANIITRESGKTIRQALKETDRCINTLTLSAEEAKRIVGEEIPFNAYPGLENRFGYYTKEPLGVILAITPFNDPLNLVAHKVGPAIAAGCPCILKPALETPLSALALAEALYGAGLPRDHLQIVIGDAKVGDTLVRDHRIAMISFTGGAHTGEAITRAAGLKRLAMDLGGNAPVIVLPDSDLEMAATECVSGAFWAAGQNCIGVQRILCHTSVLDVFSDLMVAKTNSLRLGNPADLACDVGPMISERAAARIEAWVNDAIASGATCLTGNVRSGSSYAPTVLADVPEGARVLSEEVFAPVVSIIPFSDLDEAIAQANAPEFLLHGAVFTNDLQLAQKVCAELACAGVMVNDSSDFRFDGMPFGGTKRGAMGREGVRFAIEEMSQTKVICFKHCT